MRSMVRGVAEGPSASRTSSALAMAVSGASGMRCTLRSSHRCGKAVSTSGRATASTMNRRSDSEPSASSTFCRLGRSAQWTSSRISTTGRTSDSARSSAAQLSEMRSFIRRALSRAALR